MKIEIIVIGGFMFVFFAFFFPSFYQSVLDANYTGVNNNLQSFFQNVPLIISMVVLVIGGLYLYKQEDKS